MGPSLTGMGKVIIHNQVTINGAFEAPTPEEWLELDADSGDAGLEQLILADALLLGRKTYEGLAAVWPHRAADPRRCRPHPPPVGRGHALSIRSRMAALPAGRDLRGEG